MVIQKKLQLNLLCAHSIALFSSGLLAISNANAYTQLEEITVTTGTKTERKLLDVPVRTEVITKKELVQTHARDAAEALKNQPGLLLKRIHGKSGEEVWLQGLDADRVLVLIDGRPVSASTGASVDLSQIAIGDVENIEIVKGASSVLYGSEAMGGVVNIITSKNEKPFSYSLVLDGGSYGNQDLGNTFNDKHAKVQLGGKKGKWHYNFLADVRDKQGSDIDKSTWANEGAAGEKKNFSAEIGYTTESGGNISVKPSLYKEDIASNFSSFSPGIGEIRKIKREDATRKNITLSYTKPFANGDIISTWYIHETFEDITQQDTVITDFNDQQREGNSEFNKAEFQCDKNLSDNQILTVGMTALNSSLSQVQTKSTRARTTIIDEINGNKKRDNIEFFIQDDIFVSDKLEILPGFRYQNDSDFGSHAVPKVSLMYTPEWLENIDTKLRFSVGQGYRVPTLKDRHYVFDHSALGYMVIGNPELQPETSTNFTAGIELNKNDKFRTELNFFRNDIKDLISTSLDETESNTKGLSIFKYTNIGKAQTQGLDLTVSNKLSDNFSTSLSYSYLEAIDIETNKKLTQRPAHQIKLKLDYDIPKYKANIALFGNFQSKEFVDENNTISSPSYSTFDLKLNKEILKGTKLFLGIDNITNTHRDVPVTGHDFRPESGRFIYAGIRIDG